MRFHFKLQFNLYIKLGSRNRYPWEFNILQRTLTIWAWRNIAGCRKSSHSRTKENLWVKKLYVLTEQAVFWLEVVCCLAKELGEEVDRSPSPTPTKTFFVSTKDHWSVNKKNIRRWVWNFTRWLATCGEWVSKSKLASQSNVGYWFRHQN